MIGIYGGTFNPIHIGHIRAAEEVVDILGLDRMLFVPSARPPHKSEELDIMAPASERLAWVHLATLEHPAFQVDPIEVERPGPSYLVDTLASLAARYTSENLVFVVGKDAFWEMGSWKEPRKLFAMVNIAVTTRPPSDDGTLAQWIPECVQDDFDFSEDGISASHRETHRWLRRIPISPVDVSSTGIRRRLRHGGTIRYLVPDQVLSAIEKSGCYQRAHKEEVTVPN